MTFENDDESIVIIQTTLTEDAVCNSLGATASSSSAAKSSACQNGNEPQHVTRNFCLLGCESQPPYGPMRHTATLLATLLGQAAKCHYEQKKKHSHDAAVAGGGAIFTIRIMIYNAQQQEYPKSAIEWDLYDGILLPGSFSAAYDDSSQPWIARLMDVIQTDIVAKQRPTLALCFGHQVLAHSFGRNSNNSDSKNSSGKAIPTPSGPRAGRFCMPLTSAGVELLLFDQETKTQTALTGNDAPSIDEKVSLDLFYTHGDMVEQLPDSAISLGGNAAVPIQAAAYFATSDEAATAAADGTTNSIDATTTKPRPFAFSFQGHPEYACSLKLGVKGTLCPIIDAMVQRGGISREQGEHAKKDAVQQFDHVQRQCIQSMAAVGQRLGWFQ